MTLPPAADLWCGIASGLASAVCMSFTYLLSRHHAITHPPAARRDAALGLLLRSHVVMAAAALPLAVWLRPLTMPPIGQFITPLTASAGFYFLGNIVLFGLLRTIEASRLTPFLGLKVFILAIIVAFGLGEHFSPQQWIAVSLSISATFLLQGTAGSLPAEALARVLSVCLCFALSDLFIVRMIDRLDVGASRISAAVLGMLLTYLVCGAVAGLALLTGCLRFSSVVGWPAWRAAGSYAVVWLLAMATLYVCFALVGAVYGNVVQSTRGVLSIVIGAALGHLGWHELEQRIDRVTLARRIAAAILMTVAIAVYVL